ncbi:hypothetical protein PRZ48_013743 [Zasmidium cellare]|uniref:Heterokaryon incompatibility domain-containing protein n=1 Tax=Zasmidium cellare TaxID=395010 RepID=A0ABR0E1U9_ZASCE|nr:hypothetical protein PRZ48_013743 [Zasmidium cellare]
MGEIYSRAQNVFISISIGDAHQRLEAFHPPEAKLSKSQRLTITQILQEISRHPYWERLWILQEVFCARNIYLLSNGSSVPLKVLYDIGLRFEHSLRGTSVYEILRLMREANSTGLPRHSLLTSQIQTPLRGLVSRFGDQKCKEPHDIVYGLYAMMLAPEREGIGIDYESNLETFLMNVLPFLEEHRSPFSNVEMNFVRRLFDTIPTLQTVQAFTPFPAEFWLEAIDYQIFARRGCACAYAETFPGTTHVLHFAKSHWAPPMQALCREVGSDLTLLRIDTRTDDRKLKCSRHKREDEWTWTVQFRRDDYLKLLLAQAGAEDLWTVEMVGSCAHVHRG